MSNYEVERYLPIRKNIVGMMKNELGGRIIKEFVTLKPTIYSYKNDNDTEVKSSDVS